MLRLVFAVAIVAVPSYSQAATIVVPNDLANIDGSGSGVGPFSGTRAFHLQNVFEASHFGSSGPITITGMRLRPDGAWTVPGSVFIPSLDLRLSTTTRGPGTLSTTFADNVGSNEVIVRSGSLTMSTALTGPLGGPKDFDIHIPFTTPFTYDPSKGNLLLEMRKLTGSVDGAGTGAFFHYDYDGRNTNSQVDYGGGPNGFVDSTATAPVADNTTSQSPVVAFDFESSPVAPPADIAYKSIFNPGPYAALQNTTFALGFASNTLRIRLNIHLFDDNGVATSVLKDRWENGAENIWSNHYDVVDGPFRYPIVLDVNFVDAAVADAFVTVHDGVGAWNALNWYAGGHGMPIFFDAIHQEEVAAHEIGHLLGLVDEYPVGWAKLMNGLPPPADWQSSIMGAHTTGAAKERHYLEFLKWLNSETGRTMVLGNGALFEPGEDGPATEEGSDVNAVPEPTGALLAIVGIVCMLMVRDLRFISPLLHE